MRNPLTVGSGTYGHHGRFSQFFPVETMGALFPKTIRNYKWPGNPAPRVHVVDTDNEISSGLTRKYRRSQWLEALNTIAVKGNEVYIGALTTHWSVSASPFVQKALPALSQLAASIGDPIVRHRGTLGGSIANADPSADYPAAVLALNATIVTDRREIPAGDFFRGLFETALEMDEMIVGVKFPMPHRATYAKMHQQASRFALVGVFAAETKDGIRVAVTGGPAVYPV